MKKIISFLLMIFAFLTINVKAETFDGEYSIDYLLRNYSVVTLGQKDINLPNIDSSLGYGYHFQNMNKGDLSNSTNIEGAILINGNYTSRTNSLFGTNAGQIKSFIKGSKGDNVSTTSTLVTDSNYLDFEKLYNKVTIESQELANKSTNDINSAKIEITKPGNYTIKKTSMFHSSIESGNENNTIIINDYDKNDPYIFNYYNEYINIGCLPSIKIMESESPSAISLKEYIESGKYTGNIIFNFPNAKAILFDYYGNTYNIEPISYRDFPGFSGSIVAPKANIYIEDNYFGYSQAEKSYRSKYYGTIIGNSINTSNILIIKKVNFLEL